ncbi:MAG: aminodeoxychorismate/anthranilate synthase component II [Bacteroidales bacterium]|jgi:anthranilate synthase component 2|nr:aminodeoxychorismate/anthranilate synthase component II [Bacteroidales bacterium]
MKILVLDNYDSFTYNLVHMVNDLGYTDVDVIRNDRISLEEVDRYDKIILSPGPGIPSEAGIMLDLIRKYAPTKSILGICLGEQAIGEAFGAGLENLSVVYHGVESSVVIKEEDVLFLGLEGHFKAGRYHSWIVSEENFPEELCITAMDSEGQIMAISHKEYDVRGVQFHPESVLTPEGKKMMCNWLKS